MKRNDNKRNLFSVKDIVIIILCIIALIILLFILKISKETEKNEQQQLSNMQEQIQENISSSSSYMTNGTATASIVFNEVNGQGWLELYNNGKEDINLEDYSICINGEEVKRFSSEQIIKTGTLLVVETDTCMNTQEHNLLTLHDEADNNISAMISPILSNNESYGRVENGSIQFSYQNATKEQDNRIDNMIKTENLEFSVPGGFYPSTVSLEINIPEGMEVYYTLDGTEPTIDSMKYEDAIQIRSRSGSNYQYASEEMTNYLPESIYMGTVVRAIAVDKSGKVQQTETQSYFIGMANNSDIYNTPVISITTNPENLFDYFEGMYVPGRSREDAIAMDVDTSNTGNYWNDWVKDAYIEYFEPNKDKTYESNINLSMLKDYSVESHQKGFKIAGDTEGAWRGSGLYEYFNEVSKSLTIQTNKRDNTIKLREYLVNGLLQETAVGTINATPCTVFIDGEYWGIYMLREEIDAAYLRKEYNMSDEVQVLIEKNDLFNDWDHHKLYDDFYQFVSLADMSIPSNYERVKELMDVQSYLDYLCANVYLANADYGIEESCMWRTISEGEGYADGRWRWVVGKLDNAMNNDTESRRTTSTIDTYKMPELAEDKILMSLIKSEEFRDQLQETMTRMAEEVFAEEKVSEGIQKIVAGTQKSSLTSYQRFFGNATEKTYNKEMEKVTEFFANRAEYILTYTDEVMNMDGQWYSYTESVEEETIVNEQEIITEVDVQGTVTAGNNVVSQ